ncbi:hypothetical protein HYS54_00790 [Candidatus Micrarchaeota archaeon]|nr:hypothetical protein [Candidatus Micrarchaeota archaeon]
MIRRKTRSGEVILHELVHDAKAPHAFYWTPTEAELTRFAVWPTKHMRVHGLRGVPLSSREKIAQAFLQLTAEEKDAKRMRHLKERRRLARLSGVQTALRDALLETSFTPETYSELKKRGTYQDERDIWAKMDLEVELASQRISLRELDDALRKWKTPSQAAAYLNLNKYVAAGSLKIEELDQLLKRYKKPRAVLAAIFIAKRYGVVGNNALNTFSTPEEALTFTELCVKHGQRGLRAYFNFGNAFTASAALKYGALFGRQKLLELLNSKLGAVTGGRILDEIIKHDRSLK